MFDGNLSRQNSSKSLKKYRDEVQEITRSILDLALARQNLTQRIAEVKETSGADIENHAVEEKLSSEMTEYAKSSGLDQEARAKNRGRSYRILEDSAAKEDLPKVNQNTSSCVKRQIRFDLWSGADGRMVC